MVQINPSELHVQLKVIATVSFNSWQPPQEHYCLLFLFLCNIIPSVLLIFLFLFCLTAFTWQMLGNCSCCIWGGSASSRTQTGCEVLCLLGFLCDWPQCLPTQSSHFKGDSKKTGRADLHVQHMYMLLMMSSAWQKARAATRIWCRSIALPSRMISHAPRVQEKELPFDPPIQSYTDRNTPCLYVGCHIYTGRSVFWLNNRADSSNESSLTPWVCFIPPPWLTHDCATATMLLMEKTKALGFIFLP